MTQVGNQPIGEIDARASSGKARESLPCCDPGDRDTVERLRGGIGLQSCEGRAPERPRHVEFISGPQPPATECAPTSAAPDHGDIEAPFSRAR